MATTIAFVSGKGGVGKTSLAVNTAYTLARMGKHVLLIDLDTTPASTLELGVREGYDKGDALATALMVGSPITPARRGDFLDVISGGATLKVLPGMEQAWKDAGIPVTRVLRDRVIAPLAADYDVIIIDTPPGGSGNASALALGAADYAVIPTKDDTASMQGITDAVRLFRDVADVNPDLHLLGVVLFDVARAATVELADARADATRVLGDHGRLFDTVIHESKKAARRARKAGMPVLEYDQVVVGGAKPWYEDMEGSKKVARKAGNLAKDYVAFTGEMLDRISDHKATSMTLTSQAVTR